jgi:hypothetical protein
MAQARQPVFLGAAQRPTAFGVPTVRAVHHGAVVESVRRSTARSMCGAQDACTPHGRGDVGWLVVNKPNEQDVYTFCPSSKLRNSKLLNET